MEEEREDIELFVGRLSGAEDDASSIIEKAKERAIEEVNKARWQATDLKTRMFEEATNRAKATYDEESKKAAKKAKDIKDSYEKMGDKLSQQGHLKSKSLLPQLLEKFFSEK